jgi:hypothetical protein
VSLVLVVLVLLATVVYKMKNKDNGND